MENERDKVWIKYDAYGTEHTESQTEIDKRSESEREMDNWNRCIEINTPHSCMYSEKRKFFK